MSGPSHFSTSLLLYNPFHIHLTSSVSTTRSGIQPKPDRGRVTGMPPPRATAPPPSPLYKQNSWSPDVHRDEEWTRRKHHHRRRRKSKSVTDEDIDELKACFELGFGFDHSSPELDDRLSTTFPALGFYYAVNKQYHDTISKSSSVSSSSSSFISYDLSSPSTTPHTIIDCGDNPQTVKTRLRQWAQVVACSVKLSSSS
ncbi:hypothetical protein QVD17_09974 [Tagetes erecta]|uniref:Uncharacterized protein n=1 Tax=Tagetes erecta TaxID=13708 RepID=A0AAD8P4F4_TARER|nr:hypothetical protein QVD17_09974 [Tagetes erecta]